LEEIILPNSVISIGPNAFQCCVNLQKVKLNRKTKVDEYAFAGINMSQVEVIYND